MTYRAIVEFSGPDPFGLRKQCEEQITDWLLGEPTGLSAAERDWLAASLHDRFIEKIGNTTGADRLSVTVVTQQHFLTNAQKASLINPECEK